MSKERTINTVYSGVYSSAPRNETYWKILVLRPLPGYLMLGFEQRLVEVANETLLTRSRDQSVGHRARLATQTSDGPLCCIA